MVALTTHTCLLFVNQALLGSKVWADGGTVKDAVLASSLATGEKAEKKQHHVPLNRYWDT